jgi:hypothetical protein
MVSFTMPIHKVKLHSRSEQQLLQPHAGVMQKRNRTPSTIESQNVAVHAMMAQLEVIHKDTHKA